MAANKPVLIIVAAIAGVVLMLGIGVCGVVGFIFSEGVKGAREAANRSACKNNLRAIALAVQMHQDQRGDLPPLYLTDTQGRKLHSWRVLLLPYMGQTALFRKIRLHEPWDSEYNRQFHNQMPTVYRCPVSPHAAGSGFTSYFSVAGDDAPFQPAKVDPEKPDLVSKYRSLTSIGSLVKGASNQAILFETTGYTINWMDPYDPTFDELQISNDPSQKGVGASHITALHVAFADGRVDAIPKTTSVENLRRALKIKTEDGRMPFGSPWSD